MENNPFQPYQPPQQTPGAQPQAPVQFSAPQGQPIMSGQNLQAGSQINPQGNPVSTLKIDPLAGTQNKEKSKMLILTILAIIGGLVSVTFIGLFIWMYAQWDGVQQDVDGEISKAVTEAVNEKAEEMENQFIEREKSPYSTFAGPADYGELSFEYPKTWSVYEGRDATNGGDYEAYLNPDKVYPVGTNTINALRVIIKNQSYDTFISTYENALKSGKLSVSVRLINGENANLYTGELPNSQLVGIAAVFKMRDKTAVVQTDAMLFEEDYQKVLDSIRFNQ